MVGEYTETSIPEVSALSSYLHDVVLTTVHASPVSFVKMGHIIHMNATPVAAISAMSALRFPRNTMRASRRTMLHFRVSPAISNATCVTGRSSHIS